MKIENIYKIPLFGALIALVIAVPLRVYQYFNLINPETGFYDKIDATVYILYAVSIIAVILSIAVPVAKRKKLVTVSSCKKSIGFLVVSIITAITLIADVAVQLSYYFDLVKEATAMGYEQSKYLQSQGATLILCQIVLGVISAIFFFICGISVGVGNSDGSKYKILALSPTVLCIFKLLYRFKRTISFVNVSDLLFELFAIVFLMLFFLFFAQVISKIDSQTVFWKIFAYGIPAAVLSLMCFLPRVIVAVTGNGNLLSEHYGIHYSDLGFAVFIVYNLISRAKAKEKN